MSKRGQGYVCLLLSLAVFFSPAFISLSFAASADRIPGTIDSSHLVALKGNVSLLARPQFDQGPVDGSRSMHVTLLFLSTMEQQQELKTLLAEQQDRKSPQYHKWLTVPEYADQFGLSKGDIAKISAWLQAQGFKVTYVANGRNFISFSGTASQVESVFKTQIHNFNQNGKMHFANATSPMIPAALTGIVGGFRGLHDFLPHPMLRQRPNYTFQDGANTENALAPGDIATIYNINPLYSASPAINGSGVNVVIAGQSDIYLADINYFRGDFGLTQLTGCSTNSSGIITSGPCSGGNFREVWTDGDPGVSNGDLSESDLDIETVSGVARGAEIVFVTSPSSVGGVDYSVSYAVDQKLGQVISYSYGLCEALVSGEGAISTSESVYQEAVSLGISMFAASGDTASAICDYDIRGNSADEPAIYGQSVSYPASSAYVTAVGGTEFDEGGGNYWGSSSSNNPYGGSAISYIPETAWNDTGIGNVGLSFDGSGGGASNCVNGTPTTADGYAFEVCDAPPGGGFAKPTWQEGVTPSDGVRDVPDIAFSASNVNDVYIVCTPQSQVVSNSSSTTSTCWNGITYALTQYNSAFGGTSAPTPLTAGVAALLIQDLGSSGLGLFNTQLYELFSSNPIGVFHEIQPGTNTTTGGSSSNVVACTVGDPSFETSSDVVCPSTGEMGFTVAGGNTYSQVTGVGSVNVNNFILAWAASVTSTGSFTLGASPANAGTLSAGQTTSPITVTVTPSGGFDSTVTVTCPNPPSGVSCSALTITPNGGSPATGTLAISTAPSMATGTQTVTLSATGGGTTQTSTVTMDVTATTESFTLNPPSSAPTVAPGQTATVNLTVTSTTGFLTTATPQTTVMPVTYKCTGFPSESNCTISPSTTTATTVSLAITTTAPTSKLQSPFDRGSRIFYAALLPGLFGIVFAFGSPKGTKLRGMRMLGLMMVLGFSTLWLGSCSGSNNNSSSNPGTPAGSYTIMVNATTGGTIPVTSSTTFTLTVN
jgi:subtilase family serine protease